MAATLAGIIPTSRQAKNNKGVRTYSDTYLVKSDAKTDDQFVIGSVSGLPVIGDTFPGDLAAYCHTLDVSCKEGYTGWHVTAHYSTERDIDGSDPTADEVLVAFESEPYDIPVFQDINGNAILNSAGDYLIDPSPTKRTADLIATIKANVSSVPAYVLSYQNAVNNSAITIGGLAIAQSLAQVQRITVGNREKRNSNVFYPLTLEIHIRNEGWKLEPLDAGFRERDVVTSTTGTTTGSDGQLVNIKNADESEPNTPVPLDGNGNPLEDPTPANAVFLEFDIYEEKDFTVLPGVS